MGMELHIIKFGISMATALTATIVIVIALYVKFGETSLKIPSEKMPPTQN